MIKDNKGIERYSIPTKIYDLLMRIKEKITKEDQECWVCFGGSTGTGKSLKSMQWMFPIFRGLTNDHTCFDKKEFIDAIIDAKKGTGIICDESISVLFSRQSMTKQGRLIAQLINQIRQKNLAIFLNIPMVLNLDWTAIDKLNVYVHVWESRKMLNGRLVTFKGNAAVYPELPGNQYRTRIVDYLKKKRRNPLYSYKRPMEWCTVKGEPIGKTFKKPWYPVNEAQYRVKKASILKDYKIGKGSKADNTTIERDKAIYYMKNDADLSEKQIAMRIGMTKSSVHRAIHRVKGLNA